MPRTGSRHATNLAADADMAELAFHHAFHRAGQLADGKLRIVGTGTVVFDEV
jgi:hypothetical protein